MKERIEYLIKRIRLRGMDKITYDEIATWPLEQVKELEKHGYIRQIEDADGITCGQCDEPCYKTVEVRKNLKTGELIGTFFCEDEEYGGPVTVELKRLHLWEINIDKLKESPYWQEKIEDQYISFNEAKRIVGFEDKSYFTRLANKDIIKDNGKKGQERKLLLSSVLLYKNQRENEERIKRADELHEEENAIPDRH